MSLIDFLTSLALALIMFGIGTTLSIDAFVRIFKIPKALIVGLALQMLFLPFLAFVIVYFAPIDPVFKVGLFVVALCPGGTTSNFISYLVNARTELSVSMTAINSFLILLTLPLGTTLALNYFLPNSDVPHISLPEVVQNVILILGLPVLLGLMFQKWQPRFVRKSARVLKVVNVLLLAAVFAIKFFASEQNGGAGIQSDELWTLLPYCLALHFISMIGAFVIGESLLRRTRSSITLAIEVGLQNTVLAILITGTLISNNAMSKPALVFALFSFFTTLAFAFIVRRIVFAMR